MQHHKPTLEHAFRTRREFLRQCGLGVGALGLSTLLARANTAPARGIDMSSPMAPRQPHFKARAKHVIHIFAQGGPSHVDTFDPKPNLTKYDGKVIKDVWKEAPFGGTVFGSPFKFQKHGRSGIEVSEIFPNIGKHVDEMTVVRSMYTKTPSHEHSMMLVNTGNDRLIRPSLGAWTTYGLGTENQNLPGFVCMSPGRPLQGDQNWQSAFLPGVFQGTYVDTNKKQVDQLIQFIRSSSTSLSEQRRQLNLLAKLNAEHAERREKEAQLEARIQSFEIAYRMQMEATDAFDISREPADVRAMYGENTQARQMLIARRLVERGVRFVQVWQNSWDHHSQIETGMKSSAKEIDQGVGALLTDLKQRGLLEETLVIWGGEFGRTPTVDANQNVDQSKGKGRDHHNKAFSIWMAGGGVKKGFVHGESDEWGYAVVRDKMDVPDFHATVLHLLGFDHEKLTFHYAGRDFRLTDIAGEVAKDIVA
jgi:hypothetical protein